MIANAGVRLGLTTTLGLSQHIARDLRCSRCGKRAACVHVISDVRPAHAIREDPGGGFQLGPGYPRVNPPLSPAAKAAKDRGWTWWKD